MTSPQVPEQQAMRIGLQDETLDKLVDALATLKAGFKIQQQQLAEQSQTIADRDQQIATLTKAYERLGAEMAVKDARIAEMGREVGALKLHNASLGAEVMELEEAYRTPAPGNGQAHALAPGAA